VDEHDVEELIDLHVKQLSNADLIEPEAAKVAEVEKNEASEPESNQKGSQQKRWL
jgi:hypothetical protein